jgi:hypothetical protein
VHVVLALEGVPLALYTTEVDETDDARIVITL